MNALVASSASLAYRLQAPVIAIGTVTGKSAQQLSSFRPNAFISALTHDDYIARQLVLSWGVYPVVVPENAESHTFETTMVDALRKRKFVKKGETAVLVWGSKIGISGTTNTVRTVTL